MNEAQKAAYMRTIAHLSPTEQARRMKRRERTFADEQAVEHIRQARAAGVEIGFNLRERARAAKP